MIIIFGPPGSGKSTVGVNIARRKGLFIIEPDSVGYPIRNLAGNTDDASFFQTLFCGICEHIRNNAHLDERIMLIAAMPGLNQWEHLRNVCSKASMRVLPIRFLANTDLCLSRIARAEVSERRQNAAVHTLETIEQISTMLNETCRHIDCTNIDASPDLPSVSEAVMRVIERTSPRPMNEVICR